MLVLHPVTAFSETRDDTNHSVEAEEQGKMLQKVVVTSAAMSSPLTVVTDPKAPRQPIPASDGADYLKTIPGFSTIRNGGTNGDPVFRGMFGSRLNIINDGGVILGACPGRMDNPTSYISPESYDRLTVIKGPQTVRWGPTGSAATILFERDPQHFDGYTVKGDASIVVGTDNRFESRIDGTVGAKAGYVRIIGNKALAHDYHDGDGNRIPSKWDKWNGDLFVGWTPDADTLFEISGGGGDGEARYAGRGMDGSQFKRETLGAKLIKTNVSDVLSKLEAQIYYNYADHIMDNFRLRHLKTVPSGTMNGMSHGGMGAAMDMSGMPMESRLDRRTLGGRAAATWVWGDLTIVTGFDLQTNTHRKRKSKKMMSIDGWNKDAVFTDYGLYSEATWSFAENQRFVGGARLDFASAEDEREVSATNGDKREDTLPSAFLRYEHDLEALPVTTYIGIGHTERFPDYWELFSPKKSEERYLNAFDGIKPEKTTQLDFGAQYDSADTSLWLSGYVGRVEDYILFDYRSGQSKATNVDATIMGGELGLSQHFLSNWRFDTSIAYAWGENTTDNQPLPQIPPFEGRLGLTYEQEKWSVGGLWRLVAEQTRIAKDKGNVVGKDYDKSAGFGIFSVNGSYKITDAFQLTGGVDNVFNKDYYEHLNKDGDAGFGFPSHYQVREPGRTFWAKADFKF
ncbi:TonB-dependent copper receptor [Bartonella sp. LJL80]